MSSYCTTTTSTKGNWPERPTSTSILWLSDHSLLSSFLPLPSPPFHFSISTPFTIFIAPCLREPFQRRRELTSALKKDVCLAHCWVSESQRGKDQQAEEFWGTFVRAFHDQPYAATFRSTGSFKGRFSTVAHATQKYLAAEKLYRSTIPPVATKEDTLRNIMRLHRERAATNTRDLEKELATPIKFMAALRLLSEHPKFPSVVGRSSSIRTALGQKDADKWSVSTSGAKRASFAPCGPDVEMDDSPGNIFISNPSASRL